MRFAQTENSFLNETRILDHKKNNISRVKEIKNYNFEKSKNIITNIYEKLDVRKTTLGEMRPLINIDKFLHEGIKARFMHNIAH